LLLNSIQGSSAYSSQSVEEETCANYLGSSFECWGVSNDIAAISGCTWNDPALQATNGAELTKRTKRTRRTNLWEHDDVSNATRGCVKSLYHGKRFSGKKYLTDMGRTELKRYRNLSRVKEKNKFLINNADIVRDI
jgi:hypothetical protein